MNEIPVPILVFEGRALDDDFDELRPFFKQYVADAGGKKYRFFWHPVYNALGGYEYEPVLIRDRQTLLDALKFLREDLPQYALLFFDLHFEVPNEGPIPLAFDDLPLFAVQFAKAIAPNLETDGDVLRWFNPHRIGLLLAMTAAKNKAWEGTIVFCSMRVNIELEAIKSALGGDGRIAWCDLGKALQGGSTAKKRLEGIEERITDFLDRRKGPNFWLDETAKWFANDTHSPKHNFDRNDVVGINLLKDYLQTILIGYSIPQPWLELPQVKYLHESLKGFIGSGSASAGSADPQPKQLRLGMVPILLAAQLRFLNPAADLDWMRSFEWNKDAVLEIMRHRIGSSARLAIREMSGFLGCIGWDENNNTSQVASARWGKFPDDSAYHLWIDLSFDSLARQTGKSRTLLQTLFGARWSNGKGSTVSAYERMMDSATVKTEEAIKDPQVRRFLHVKPADFSPPSFSLCIYPIPGHGSENRTRLDFRAYE